MSRSDSDFERSNVSLKENKLDGVNPNSNDIGYYVRKNEGKFFGFRQTVQSITFLNKLPNYLIFAHLRLLSLENTYNSVNLTL